MQDLEQARSLLKQAGHDGLTITLTTSDIAQGTVRAAESFAQQASGAGVTVTYSKLHRLSSSARTGCIGCLVKTIGRMTRITRRSALRLYRPDLFTKLISTIRGITSFTPKG